MICYFDMGEGYLRYEKNSGESYSKDLFSPDLSITIVCVAEDLVFSLLKIKYFS